MDTHKQSLKINIRWLIRRDMAEVMEIERQSFEFAWSEEDFLCCLRQRNHIGMVAVEPSTKPCPLCRNNWVYRASCKHCCGTGIGWEDVLGYMIYELHKNRLRILNFAVETSVRRQRVASQMVRRLIDKLSQQHRKEIVLDIRESNLIAQLFFKSQEFKAIGILRNFYEDTIEDAYSMRYVLTPQNDIYSPFCLKNRITKYEEIT